MDLTPYVEAVKGRRADVDKAKEEEERAFIKHVRELKEKRQEEEQRLKNAEDQLRCAEIEEFNATGVKSLPFGLGIRESDKVEYDKEAAREWCEENAPQFLERVLRSKAYEAFIRSNHEDGFQSDAPGRVVHVVTATIPKEFKE